MVQWFKSKLQFVVGIDFQEAVYSFDFGTSNTVVARWNRALAQPETLAVRSLSQVESPPLVPSVLYVQDAERTGCWRARRCSPAAWITAAIRVFQQL